MAKRNGHENEHLQDVTELYKKLEMENHRLTERLKPASLQSSITTPITRFIREWSGGLFVPQRNHGIYTRGA
jgi:hypothetical protein